MSLDPWQMPLRVNGGGYRLWSRSIGQYSLFDEVTHGTSSGFVRWLFKEISLEDAWTDYKYTRSLLILDSTKNVNELLFKRIQKAFKTELPPRPLLRPVPPPEAKRKPPPKDYAPPDAAAAQRRRRDLDEDLDFFPEFQELILIWHVTTEVFLLESNGQRSPEVDEGKYVEAINAVSNYMAFLAAVRSEMLPGLKLRSRHQATREALDSLWRS
jgi:hypothetical protein